MLDIDYDTFQKRMTSCTVIDKKGNVSLQVPNGGKREGYETFGSDIMRLGSMRLPGRVEKVEGIGWLERAIVLAPL